jgi:hypothetical protein
MLDLRTNQTNMSAYAIGPVGNQLFVWGYNYVGDRNATNALWLCVYDSNLGCHNQPSGSGVHSVDFYLDSTVGFPGVSPGIAVPAIGLDSTGKIVPASGGGTTTNPLTGAAAGGAAPGATFNGSAAVTFDYHTLGADVAGAAAAVTLSSLGAVPTTTTVNGHALSSNVVISASNLTTGTLPHAQLPTLLSGDIPNNAANTTGTSANVTTTSNSTLTTLSALALPYSQITGTPSAYVLPTATSTVLGGVKPNGTSILNTAGTISATAASVGADVAGAAATAQSNAETYASNASNLSSGTVAAARVATLNQNTTGTSGSVTNAFTLNNSNSGAASGTTYNGSAAVTLSANTLGAGSLANTNSWSGLNTFSKASTAELIGSQGVTVTIQSGAGTGGSVAASCYTVAGNQCSLLSGLIITTTGSSGVAAGHIAEIKTTGSATSNALNCIVQAAGPPPNGASLSPTLDETGTTYGQFYLNLGSAPTINTSYLWFYHCLE